MKILLDEGLPQPAVSLIKRVLHAHQVDHIHQVGWSGKDDQHLYHDAARRGYQAVVTNDRSQMADPDECRAIKRSGIHWITYPHRYQGTRGLAAAAASILAALPDAVEELDAVDGQRIVNIQGVALRPKRYDIIDPRRNPPKYWPR